MINRMKTNSKLWTVCVGLFVAVSVCDAGEYFESLKIGDTVRKKVRVIADTPVDVLLYYEGGRELIKRKDLPQELKAKYPYDAKKAEEFEKQNQEQSKPSEPQLPPQEDLGTFTVDGKTYKILRVIKADPAAVQVAFEGGGGKRILRKDLPPQLKTKYPYEPGKAEDFEKQRTKARQSNETAELKANLQRKAVELRASIDSLNKQNVEIQKRAILLAGGARGRPSYSAERLALDQLGAIRLRLYSQMQAYNT